MGGQVTMMFDVVTLARESVKAGKMRALGVAAKERVAVLDGHSDIGGGRLARARNERLVRVDCAGRNAARHLAWLNREANKVFSRPRSGTVSSRRAPQCRSARRRRSARISPRNMESGDRSSPGGNPHRLKRLLNSPSRPAPG